MVLKVRESLLCVSLKLSINHRSVPIHLEVILADHFHFQAINLVDHSQMGLRRPQLRATRSPRLLSLLLPRFQNGSLRSDFPILTPIHTHVAPFCGFCFCEIGSVPLTDCHISVFWSSRPNETPNRMEFQLFPRSSPIFMSFLH
ncbi:hypothetical protein AVEN_237271-1 [Araneus ventricosus]|uniref:Uncharacterized protein n=1 Tax=Araneus ventricosus TaxID=182803 RepID=A0A4Y2TD95_ARAVE|nr:hypothetical protein AVEN_237271-1 [Araneus ventricosus]